MAKESNLGGGDTRALKEAVRRMDPTFFGGIFDLHMIHMSRLKDGRTLHAARAREAFKLTMADPVIQRAGIETVIELAQDPVWSDRYLSPDAREALDEYIRETAEAQTPSR